jgi:dolichyl-phosphate beta-glucosyltransferase
VPQRILLVIPAYRERDRLPRFLPRLCECLTRSRLEVEVRIVDDGSGDDQTNWLKQAVEDLSRRFPLLLPPLLLPKNGGKGQAVYEGWQQNTNQAPWLAFVDADGAVSAEELARVLAIATDSPPTTTAVYAVRTGQAHTLVKRDWRRKLSGWCFRLLVQKLFHFPVPDTQCGCKAVRSDAFQRIHNNLPERRFCFDVELTHHLLAQGGKIDCVPINWTESPGSRLGLKSVFLMATSLLRLKRQLK